ASRMESHGLPNEIQITESTADLIRSDFELEERGEIEVKGKGKIKTFLVKQRIREPEVSLPYFQFAT
ncbi:hypothetical protein EHQ55_07095, partial [Leptospira meyeri]